jgi:hypothetical protein
MIRDIDFSEARLYNLSCQNLRNLKNERYRGGDIAMTDEERRLTEKAMKFEDDYFEDITFRPGTPIHEYFIHVPAPDPEDCEKEGEGGFNIETLGLSITSYSFKVSKLRNSQGWTNGKKLIITISAKYLEDDSTLLHEMLHAYEDTLLIRDYLLYRLTLRDLLTHFLYKDLSDKINRLDFKIHEYIHLRPYDDQTRGGGFHSLLFLLKSLDLDLRLGTKLGTVFGYGLDKEKF